MNHPDPQPIEAAGPPPPRPSGSLPALRNWIVTGVLAIAFMVAAIAGVNLLAGTSASQATESVTTTSTNKTSTTADRPAARQPNGVAGRITAIDGSTITISSPGPKPKDSDAASKPEMTTFTVATSASTSVSKVTDGVVGDLSKGDTIVVDGVDSNGTIAAKRIHQTDIERPDGPPAGKAKGQEQNGGQTPRPGRPTIGTITTVSGSTITVKTLTGATVKVTTASDTKVSVIEKSSISELAKGDTSRVKGTVSGAKVAATAITEGPLGAPRGGHGPGGCDAPGTPGQTPAPGGNAPSTTQPS